MRTGLLENYKNKVFAARGHRRTLSLTLISKELHGAFCSNSSESLILNRSHYLHSLTLIVVIFSFMSLFLSGFLWFLIFFIITHCLTGPPGDDQHNEQSANDKSEASKNISSGQATTASSQYILAVVINQHLKSKRLIINVESNKMTRPFQRTKRPALQRSITTRMGAQGMRRKLCRRQQGSSTESSHKYSKQGLNQMAADHNQYNEDFSFATAFCLPTLHCATVLAKDGVLQTLTVQRMYREVGEREESNHLFILPLPQFNFAVVWFNS